MPDDKGLPGFLVLIIMSPVQVQLAKKYGNNIITIDGPKFVKTCKITTIMVESETQSCIPVAYLITDATLGKLNHTMMSFFAFFRKQTGINKVNVLMDEMDLDVYRLWTKIFGKPANRWYCPVELEKQWKENIYKTNDTELQNYLMQSFQTLREETDLDRFKEKFEIFKKAACRPNQHIFVELSLCPERWAYCYRNNIVYKPSDPEEKKERNSLLENIKTCPLPKVLHSIMSILKKDLVKKIQGSSKEIIAEYKNGMAIRHDNTNVSVSYDLEREIYLVDDHLVIQNKNHIECPNSCEKCQICYDCYVCSCLDFAINPTICRHIHAVALAPKMDRSRMENVWNETKKLEALKNLLSESWNDIKKIIDAAKPGDDLENFCILLKNLQDFSEACTKEGI